MILPRFLRRHHTDEPGFVKNERGSALVEFVLVFPMLIWAFLGIFLFWDAFKAINTAQKASFIVADALSRATTDIAPAYIDGMADLLAYLSSADSARGEEVRLRVSSIKWDSVTARHSLAWSYSPDNGYPVLTSAALEDIDDKIPTLTAFETVLVVETEVDFIPALTGGNAGGYTLGVGSRTFTEFVVIRPRFIPKVCLKDTACT
jgi:TadE-like protein